MTDYHKPPQNQTTPDPITTAREALPYVYHPGVSPELWAEALAKVNAALDYATTLQTALSVTQEEGRTEIARLEAELEKLKAERDELHAEAKLIEESHADDQRMIDRIADIIGLPQDQELDTVAFELWASEQKSVITRLTSQLEQAERAISPFADAYSKWLDGGYKEADLVGEIRIYDPVYGVSDDAEFSWEDIRAASQWIKDRQAKTDHLPDVGNMVAVQPMLEWEPKGRLGNFGYRQLIFNGKVIGTYRKTTGYIGQPRADELEVMAGRNCKGDFLRQAPFLDWQTEADIEANMEQRARQWLSGGDK